MLNNKLTLILLVLLYSVILISCGDSDSIVEDGDLDSDTVETENDTAEDGDSEEDQEAENTDYATLSIENNHILLKSNTTLNYVELLPAIIVDNQFYGAGENGECTSGESFVTCSAGEYGEVTAHIENNYITTEFSAEKDFYIEGIILKGSGEIKNATSWLSNGFQSWSQSGILKLGEPLEYDEIHKALTIAPSTETLRQGRELSWFYSYAGGGETSIFAGVTDAVIFKPWINWSINDDKLSFILGNGGAGESISLAPKASIQGERWYVDIRKNLEALLLDYGNLLSTRKISHPHPPQIGWNSWYDLWYFIEQEDILENAPLAKNMLEEYKEEGQQIRIVVDDGWQKKWGEWEADEGFEMGMDKITEQLGQNDLSAGIWLAPVLVDPQSELVSNHPDWFVGGGLPDNPDVYYTHEIHGKLLVLDVTNPEVVEHIKGFISRIVDWGYSLLKIDFLFAAAMEGKHYEDVTGIQAYNKTLKIIREAAGEDTILLAVGSPPVPTSKYVDAWRLGGDIAWFYKNDVLSWHFAVNQARCISARWFICQSMLCDADPALLRQLNRNEVEFGVWVASLAGGFMFLSDDLRELDSERKSWGIDAEVMNSGLSGLPSVPEYFFPDDPPEKLSSHAADMATQTNNHVLPQIWKNQNGQRVFFNLSNETVDFEGNQVEAHGVFITK